MKKSCERKKLAHSRQASRASIEIGTTPQLRKCAHMHSSRLVHSFQALPHKEVLS